MRFTETFGPLSHTRFSRRIASCSHWTMANSVVPFGAHAVADLAKALRQNRIESALRRIVAGDLFFTQHRFKMADQIRGADDFLAHPAQYFDRSGIDQRDIHDRVARRVLHRQPGGAFEHLASCASSSCHVE